MECSCSRIIDRLSFIVWKSDSNRLIDKHNMRIIIPRPYILSCSVHFIFKLDLNRAELPKSRALAGHTRPSGKIENDRCRVIRESLGGALPDRIVDGGLGWRYKPINILISGVCLIRYIPAQQIGVQFSDIDPWADGECGY